jgi:hypothetical protein
MTRRGIGVTVLGALAVTVGALLGWIEVTAVGAALLVLVALTFGFRFPRSAQWHDVSVPARVVRGDEASITVGVTVPSGSTTWVSAVDGDGRHRGWLPDGERSTRRVAASSRAGHLDSRPRTPSASVAARWPYDSRRPCSWCRAFTRSPRSR